MALPASLAPGEFALSAAAGKRAGAVEAGRAVAAGAGAPDQSPNDQAGKVRRPAAPLSRPNSSRAPVASQLSALTGPPPGSRTGISAASAKRHSRTTPSA